MRNDRRLVPLYLGPQSSVQLDLGPSLVVRAPGMALARYPLARLARVVVHRGCQMDLKTLAWIAGAGVPVTIVGGHQRLFAVCLSGQRSDADWRRMIEHLWTLHDWRERYDNWLRAQTRIASRAALHRLGAPQPNMRPAQALQLFEAAAEKGGISRWMRSRTMQAWQAATMAFVAERAAARGLRADIVERPGMGWHWLHDITRLLLWDLRLYMVQEARRWVKMEAALDEPGGFSALRAAWAAGFEQRAPRLERLLARTIDRFHRWLAEMTWPAAT